MTQFADLHLCPDLNEKENIKKLIFRASKLGYHLIGVSMPANIKGDIVDFLWRTCRDHNLDFSMRIDITPKSSADLLKSLRKVRRAFELIAVNCISKAVARQAAKDHRVDLLVFPSLDPRRHFFDLAEARLASQGLAALEINMALLLQNEGFARARLLSLLRKEVLISRKHHVPIIICSGATDSFGIRDPFDFINLAELLSIGDTAALEAMSTIPKSIVKRNREKLDRNYVMKGVRIIGRNKDCAG